MLNCENVAIDRVIETLGVRNEEENDIQTTIIRYTPFYRLYLLTQVVTNLLTPFLFCRFITHRMYLSCPAAWSQKNGQPSSTLMQLLTSELTALQQRLNTGENLSCSRNWILYPSLVIPLNLQIPGASGPQAFEEASGIIQHNQLQSLSQAILSFFLAMAGYALKGYKQSSAVRQFSSNLMGTVEDRFRGRNSVSRVNQYIGGTSCK